MDPTLMGFLGGIVGAGIGGVFAMWAANKQTMALMTETSGNVNERLYNQNLEIMRFLAEHPNLYPYFFSNKELGESMGETEREQVYCTAAMIIGFMNLIAVQIDELPEGQRPNWNRYVMEQYEASGVLRRQIDSHSNWYCSGVLKLISDIKKTDRANPV
ncbi:MAG TPA: hypothetical protein VIL74_19480 [Pyrinomonadaceae bacterium]|jgi:hypothetical protein